MEAPLTDDKSRRWLIFRQLAPYFGKSVTAEFLKKTSNFLPDIERIHPLIEGIYKPAWSDYALAIASMIDNPYEDEIQSLEDGRWWIMYSPKAGGMEIAQAAHIIPKKEHGSDDPRNGMSLSRSMHWALDRGIFTVSNQYEIVVNPKARDADHDKFPVLDMQGARIGLPEDEQFWPHPDALKWHKEEVFGRFEG